MTTSLKKIRLFRTSYERGMPMRAIAKQEQISTATVKKYLQRAGVKVQEQNRVKQLRTNDERLIGLYCGLWAGDGTQFYDKGYRIKICLHSGNKELIKFTQDLLWQLFGKKSGFVHDHGNYSGFVIFNSQFIYHFIGNYLSYEEYKTKTVRLKSQCKSYSQQFLEGFFLGLMLSDGHMKQRIVYQTISKKLASDLILLLTEFGFSPYTSTARREKYGWNDLHAVYLSKSETVVARRLLNKILGNIGYQKTFDEVKGLFP